MLPFQTFIPLFWIPSIFFLFLAVLGFYCYTQTFSSCSKWDHSLVALHRLLVKVASLVVEHALWGAQAQQLWCMGPVTLWQVESSWTGDQTCVSCSDRQSPNHWTTKEVHILCFEQS